MRECGSCTLCCKILGVTELEKPPQRWCSHCNIGQGCGIYAERPETCRSFQCMWLANPELSDELRPDRCGVVLVAYEADAYVTAQVNPHKPDAMKRPAMRRAVELIKRHGKGVVIACGSSPGQIKVDAPPGVDPRRIVAAVEKKGWGGK